MNILLVENSAAPISGLREFLSGERISSAEVDTGEKALELLALYKFDLMLLNLDPDMNAGAFVSRVRAAGSGIPILVIAEAAQKQQHRVDALSAGADDVIAQPVDRPELLARLHAVLRRSRGDSEPTMRVGKLVLHLERQGVTVGETDIPLTVKEFAILRLLMTRKNVALTREAILSNIYSGRDAPEAKIIDVFICKLRRKLADAGAPIVISTIWGRGYSVRDPARDNDDPVSPPTSESDDQRVQHMLTM